MATTKKPKAKKKSTGKAQKSIEDYTTMEKLGVILFAMLAISFLLLSITRYGM